MSDSSDNIITEVENSNDVKIEEPTKEIELQLDLVIKKDTEPQEIEKRIEEAIQNLTVFDTTENHVHINIELKDEVKDESKDEVKELIIHHEEVKIHRDITPPDSIRTFKPRSDTPVLRRTEHEMILGAPPGNFALMPDPFDQRDYPIKKYQDITGVTPLSFSTLDLLLPIRDQLQQGTCVAFAAACCKEYEERKEHPSFQEYMSPQFIYNCRANFPGAGMTSRDLMNILLNIGSVTEKTYPYGKEENLLDPKNKDLATNLFDSARNYRVASYARVTTVDEAKLAMVNKGPLHISFPVYNYTEQFWKGTGEMMGGHAVALVGYNETGFILRNSWGMKYGKNGYCTFPYGDWSMHWDCWAFIDAHSKEIPTVIEDKKCCTIL